MDVFSATLKQMLVLFTFIAIGFILNRKKVLAKDSYITISRLETYLLVPALCFTTFSKYCTLENLKVKWIYLVYGTAIVAVSLVIGHILARIFAKEDFLKRIYTYSFSFSNFGFMGNAVVLGVFGEEALFDYMFFTLPFQLYVYSYGALALTPMGARFTPKSLLNPSSMGMLLGGIIGVLNIPLPQFASEVISTAGSCMSPFAMILTGLVVANYSIKGLVSHGKVYLATFLRLIVLPLFFVGALKLLGTDSEIIKLTLCSTAMPLGLNTVVYPAAYGGDTLPGSSMALVSHVLAIITIPVMFYIVL